MVAGRVKAAMGFHRSPSTPKPPQSQPQPQSHSGSRSFAHRVQPSVPDLLRLIEDLRETESRLRTELLEHKILKETVAIVPFLEGQLASKSHEIASLQAENRALRSEIDIITSRLRKQDHVEEVENKIADMEAQIEDLKRILAHQHLQHHRRSALPPSSSSSSSSSSSPPRPAKAIAKEAAAEPELTVPDAKHDNAEAEKVESDGVSGRSRPSRVPKPPPTPSFSTSDTDADMDMNTNLHVEVSAKVAVPMPPMRPPPPPPPPPLVMKAKTGAAAIAPPPPPPPPPPPKAGKGAAGKVTRVPEVVEFYHSLMRRDSKRDTGCGGTETACAASTKNMIGEIENRSAYLLAIKTEVETQGDFIRFLIKEVQGAAFTNIEDVVAFVKWLDDELSFLVDERAVLKHFDWPEHKADAMREAAFGYNDLKKLELEVSSFKDDIRQPCGQALKKMQSLFEKLEHGVYNLSRVREAAMERYKGFRIPCDWMLETGFVTQLKLASVKLAMKYMKRVSAELEAVGGGTEEEELVLRGVRFAFRVHQFAGGFDMETMRAFEELRDKVHSCRLNNQARSGHRPQAQRPPCRSSAC